MKSDKLIGTRYGRLTIIGGYEAGHRKSAENERKPATVLCRCDCGTEKRFVMDDLRSDSTKSCGCFRSENSSENGRKVGRTNGLVRRKRSPKESSEWDLYIKYMARNPGNLQFQLFCQLTQLSCYFCGVEPRQIYLVKNCTDNEAGKFIYNGLDRVDNSRGYDDDNVKPCCGTCNFMRHKLSLDDFYHQLIKIVNNHKNELVKLGLQITS